MAGCWYHPCETQQGRLKLDPLLRPGVVGRGARSTLDDFGMGYREYIPYSTQPRSPNPIVLFVMPPTKTMPPPNALAIVSRYRRSPSSMVSSGDRNTRWQIKCTPKILPVISHMTLQKPATDQAFHGKRLVKSESCAPYQHIAACAIFVAHLREHVLLGSRVEMPPSMQNPRAQHHHVRFNNRPQVLFSWINTRCATQAQQGQLYGNIPIVRIRP